MAPRPDVRKALEAYRDTRTMPEPESCLRGVLYDDLGCYLRDHLTYRALSPDEAQEALAWLCAQEPDCPAWGSRVAVMAWCGIDVSGPF